MAKKIPQGGGAAQAAAPPRLTDLREQIEIERAAAARELGPMLRPLSEQLLNWESFAQVVVNTGRRKAPLPVVRRLDQIGVHVSAIFELLAEVTEDLKPPPCDLSVSGHGVKYRREGK